MANNLIVVPLDRMANTLLTAITMDIADNCQLLAIVSYVKRFTAKRFHSPTDRILDVNNRHSFDV